jgi:APA family basic amino acid/polyamine antiporter
MAASGTKPALGLSACIALVVGNMIGSGVFLLPSALAQFGPISIAGWVITSTGAIMLALVFGRLARQVPKTGGPYAYTGCGRSTALGRTWSTTAFSCSWQGCRCSSGSSGASP